MSAATCPACGHVLHQRKGLTHVQRSVYVWIVRYMSEQSIAPTLQEIAEAYHYNSLSTVAELLRHIERKGWITMDHGVARSIALVEPVEA